MIKKFIQKCRDKYKEKYEEDIKRYVKKYDEDIKKSKEYLKSVKTWYKLIPNLLTILRPIGMIPANILFFTGNILPATLLTGALLATDFVDGKLARKWDCQSKLGADLDAVGDKIMFFGMALPLIVSNPIMLINILLEGAISYVNICSGLKGLDAKTNYIGKVKTWFLSLTLVAGYLVKFFSIPYNIFSLLISATTLFQGLTLFKYIRTYKKMEMEKTKSLEIMDKDDDSELKGKSREELIEELLREKNFVLSTLEPNKVYSGKKRVRRMLQDKRTIK